VKKNKLMFKKIILSIALLGILPNYFAQQINFIEYKKECDLAYKSALEKEEYKSSISQLKNIKTKYKILFCEEYILMAYCYKKINHLTKSAETLKTALSNYGFDLNCYNQVDQIQIDSITKGFSEKLLLIVDDGYENITKLKPKFSDSIIHIFEKIDLLDQKVHNVIAVNNIDSLILAKEIRQVDSLNLIMFKNIILKHGYPGEKILPWTTGYPFLILTRSAKYEYFYKEMQPILYNEVKNGRMPPSHYVFWLDKHNQSINKSLEYGIIDEQSQAKLNEEQKIEIKKKRIELGLIGNFPIPSFELTVE